MNKKLIRKMLTASGGPIHYSRTMTTDNLSKAANYVGNYILKGLGAFGKIMAAPFVQLGPTSATIYKSKKLLAKEKAIELKSEELLGKAMTWVSPLNYGAALVTGNGLNARKGEEEVASWSPAWQAVGRLGELYVGPKAVKGVKSAVKAGVKQTKAAVVARKINKVVNETNDLSKLLAFDLFQELTSAPTSKITRLRPEFSLAMQDKNYMFGKLLWSTNLTKDRYATSLTKHIKVMDTKLADPQVYVTQALYPLAIKNGGLRAAHGGLTRPIWLNSNKPYFGTPTGVSNSTNYTYIIDANKFTPELNLLRNIGGTHYEYPGTAQLPIEGTKRILWDPVLLQYTSTIFTEAPKSEISSTASLKFFERKPSKISEAEKAGVPKGERNNVNNSGNLERTVNDIILENGYSLPKETGMFAQKHSSIGSSYRKTFERLWGKENTDQLTDDLLGKLILIRNHLIDTNIPLKGDFVYVVDGQAKAYRNGLEIGYLNNSYIDNGKALHPEMVKKQGTNNAGVSELLYNGTILAENRPIISGSRLLMPEVTTHIWSKYPTRKLISTEGVHAWPLRTAQERGIKLNYEKNWHTLPEFSKLHQLALDENIRTNLIGLPIYELSEPSYLPMVKNARVFDISLLRDGYINLDFTPGFAYKQGGKMNILEFLKNGSGIHIKKENRGKFTDYCGGKVTDECILKGKNSSNPAIRKRATFAANARKWKHLTGGTLVETLGGGNTITAKLKAKSNLTKRKAPDWDNLDRGYRYLTLDMKLPHDLAIAIMGNVVEESQGDYKAALKNGRGRGLIQWDGRPAPKGRYGQWGSIWASVAKKANVYDPDTDTVKNYWAPWNGLKGDLVRLKFISAPLKLKARIYAESYLRPGKPRIADRQLSAMQLDSIYNPKIKNVVVQLKVGGKIDFLSLGGIASGIKNIVNNVGSFMKSDTGKSILSAGSSLLGLGKSISNSGKIADAANEAEEAINALESADRLKSFAEKYATILLEKLSKPDIDVNGSPIHTNGVNVTNEAYNLAVNTFNFDNSKYNQMRELIEKLALQALGENSSSMAGSVGNLISSIGGIAGSLLNKKSTAPKTSLVITGNPDSSKQVITTNSGMSGTVDDWRKAILG